MPLGSVLKIDSNPFFSPAAAKSFSIKNDEIMKIAKNTNIFTNVFNTRLKNGYLFVFAVNSKKKIKKTKVTLMQMPFLRSRG